MKKISTMNEGEYFQAAADAMQSPENATLEYLCDLMKSAREAESTLIGHLIDDFTALYMGAELFSRHAMIWEDVDWVGWSCVSQTKRSVFSI